jgi:hypothetical protein
MARLKQISMAPSQVVPLIFWNQLPESELLMVTEGRCPQPPPPHAALVKAPLRIAGLLFVEAASTAFQGGTDIRAFRFLYEGRYMSYACEQQGTATRDSPRDARR